MTMPGPSLLTLKLCVEGKEAAEDMAIGQLTHEHPTLPKDAGMKVLLHPHLTGENASLFPQAKREEESEVPADTSGMHGERLSLPYSIELNFGFQTHAMGSLKRFRSSNPVPSTSTPALCG